MKKYLSLLLALLLMLCPTLGALASSVEDAPADTISKSKTATNLNADLETTVTLSFPSEEVSLDADVVFVLDKSTSADVEDDALQMLQDLQGQLEGTTAKIKVGVVIFDKEAHNETNGLLDLSTQYDKIEAAMKKEISSGTNTHAGLLAGKKLLDADTSVDASRKHLIFVSDGITYMFGEEPTAVAWGFYVDNQIVYWAGPENWAARNKGSNEPPTTWNSYLDDDPDAGNIGRLVNLYGDEYDYPYGELETAATNYTNPDDNYSYANSVDKALYLTRQVYQDCKDAGYNCYALTANQNSGTDYKWGPSFMEYLADGKTWNFSDIKAEILYLLGRNSTVEDVIGNDFDLIEDSFLLSVGGSTYPAIREGNNYYFGDKQYMVEYKPNADGGESFTFTINEDVTNFQRVQLSYRLKVTNPETNPGTYGQYDRDGSKGYDGLYTNESAVLNPIDSQGREGGVEEFQKPTVSYTVKAPDANVPQTGDNSVPALWAALCALSAAAFVVLSRRRHA